MHVKNYSFLKRTGLLGSIAIPVRSCQQFFRLHTLMPPHPGLAISTPIQAPMHLHMQDHARPHPKGTNRRPFNLGLGRAAPWPLRQDPGQGSGPPAAGRRQGERNEVLGLPRVYGGAEA